MNIAVIERLLCLLDVRMHALALCEVSRGARLKLPSMEAVLVHYIIEGQGVLTGYDGPPIPFKPNTLIFLPPKTSHEIAERGDETDVILGKEIARPLHDGLVRFGCAGQPVVVSACGTIDADCEGIDLFAGMREPLVDYLGDDQTVSQAFGSMLTELQRPRFGSKPLAEALMKQCLILAFRIQAERGEVTALPFLQGNDPRLIRALLELMENPARDHSVDELAAASGMSRSVFAERFTRAFERPPIDLLKQIRLHRAANLLRSTSLPVQVVGLAVGYTSRSYFSRAFRAAYDRDPKAFREEARTRSAGATSTQEKSNATN